MRARSEMRKKMNSTSAGLIMLILLATTIKLSPDAYVYTYDWLF